MTWQAYNIWGGPASTRIPPVISVAGPTRSLRPPFTTTHCGAHRSPWDSTFRWPGSPTRWASITCGSATQISPAIQACSGAAGVVSTGHDEYTASYWQGLLDAQDSGSDLAFLGANAGYWRGA